jgi:hypothetical protein
MIKVSNYTYDKRNFLTIFFPMQLGKIHADGFSHGGGGRSYGGEWRSQRNIGMLTRWRKVEEPLMGNGTIYNDYILKFSK